MVKRTKVIVVVLASVALLLCLGCAALYVWMAQGFSNPVLTILPTPGLPGAEVWLLEKGLQDRGVILYVTSPSLNHGKAVKITPLDWDGLYSFSKLQWSKDGQFVVLTVRLAGENRAEINAFAYDFSNRRAVLPEWQGRGTTAQKTLAEWREYEKTIAALAEAHGSMSGTVLGRDDSRARAHKLWFWQVPK